MYYFLGQHSIICLLLHIYTVRTYATPMKTLNQLTYVNKSNIHGKGLFARVDIPENTVIGTLDGTPCKKDGPHVLWLDDTQGIKVTCDLKFINHADKPNACYYDDLTVVALKDIRADEEITHNYETADW